MSKHPQPPPARLSPAVLLLSAALGASAVANPAAAQGDLRLHLETGAVAFEFTSVDTPAGDADSESSAFGLFPADTGVGVGFMLARGNLVGVTSWLYATDNGDADFRLKLLPYYEFLFGGGDSLRPFVGLTGGIDHTERGGGGPDGDNDRTGVILGGFGGLHIMLGGGASLDLTARLTYEFWSDGDVDGSTLGLGIFIGLSAWT